MSITVIYHRVDYDGITCREIARKFLPRENTTFIGWTYGDPTPEIAAGEIVFMLDVSVDELMSYPHLIWIDHHKTSYEKYPQSISGLRMDGVAACRLAYHWFQTGRAPWATEQDFIDRNPKLEEPLAVTLNGEWDVWDKRDPNVDIFHYGLDAVDLNWNILLDPNPMVSLHEQEILRAGSYIQRAAKVQHERAMLHAFDLKWEGLTFLCLNGRDNSAVFENHIQPHHEGLMLFRTDGNLWRFSLYGAGAGIDLSKIAVKYGGGGHPNACGFEAKELPFKI